MRQLITETRLTPSPKYATFYVLCKLVFSTPTKSNSHSSPITSNPHKHSFNNKFSLSMNVPLYVHKLMMVEYLQLAAVSPNLLLIWS